MILPLFLIPLTFQRLLPNQPSLIMSRIEDTTTEPAYMDEELTQGHIAAHVPELPRPQAGRRRRRNQFHSFIYTLPPELLEVIFLSICASERTSWEKFDGHTGQVIVLSSVSSHWRQVVLSTASLWESWDTTTLAVHGRTSEIKAALLQHHLEHARNLDLSLYLYADKYGLDDMMHPKQYQSIANTLFAPQNARKVTTLHVINPPPNWLVKLSKLPRIETLVLEGLREKFQTQLTLDLHPSQKFGEPEGLKRTLPEQSGRVPLSPYHTSRRENDELKKSQRGCQRFSST